MKVRAQVKGKRGNLKTKKPQETNAAGAAADAKAKAVQEAETVAKVKVAQEIKAAAAARQSALCARDIAVGLCQNKVHSKKKLYLMNYSKQLADAYKTFLKYTR